MITNIVFSNEYNSQIHVTEDNGSTIMANILDSIGETVDWFLSILSSSIKQTTESYCDIETADSHTTLVSRDGSLLSVINRRTAAYKSTTS